MAGITGGTGREEGKMEIAFCLAGLTIAVFIILNGLLLLGCKIYNWFRNRKKGCNERKN